MKDSGFIMLSYLTLDKAGWPVKVARAGKGGSGFVRGFRNVGPKDKTKMWVEGSL